jgi:hypothetical protein
MTGSMTFETASFFARNVDILPGKPKNTPGTASRSPEQKKTSPGNPDFGRDGKKTPGAGGSCHFSLRQLKLKQQIALIYEHNHLLLKA